MFCPLSTIDIVYTSAVVPNLGGIPPKAKGGIPPKAKGGLWRSRGGGGGDEQLSKTIQHL